MLVVATPIPTSRKRSAVPKITNFALGRNIESSPEELTLAELRQAARSHANAVVALAEDWGSRDEPVTFKEFELALRTALFALGRLLVMLFLARREQRVMREHPASVQHGRRRFRRAPAQARNLSTLFGVVRYWRTYFREVAKKKRRGFYPLDVALGLTADRFSWNVLSQAARLACKMSFAEARAVLASFVVQAPSTEVIEKTVLGLGHHTAAWYASAPVPDDDGDVLVIQIDSKGAPTATKTELSRRRGRRHKRRVPKSARHRGRHRRIRYPSKPRRKKGDKSKNAKMATLVVMYTLKRQGKYLLGPRNRWHYASFAPKRHAFEIARREADRRGFHQGSRKVIQVVTDGDLDLACYAAEYFPEAIHTVDVMHVVEKIWMAGECLHPEGSDELKAWMQLQKKRLYGGKEALIVAELRAALEATPTTGPGNKGRRKRLTTAVNYLDKRLEKMNYADLIVQDMEIGSGMVEGAIKNLIGKRCDHGGMRWIKERAEAVVQLRCIEANGDWEAFTSFVHDRLQAQSQQDKARSRLQSAEPAPLPEVKVAA
jgi:hypothetical protein